MREQTKVSYVIDFPIVHMFGSNLENGLGDPPVTDSSVIYVYEEHGFDCKKIGETTLFKMIEYCLEITMGNNSLSNFGSISASNIPIMKSLHNTLLLAAQMIEHKLPKDEKT